MDTDKRKKKALELLSRVLEVETSQRRAWLRDMCGNDQDLERSALQLLSLAENDAVGFFEQGLAKLFGPEAAERTGWLPEPFSPGHRVGRYRVLAHLGSGGMGAVYRVHDEELGRDVALKVVFVNGNAQIRTRFKREARAVAAMDHPNIVTLYDVGEEGGLLFLTMEILPGKTLDKLIPEQGMSPTEFFSLALQITSAVAAIHRLHIIHRDLKPSNIMVRKDGRVKVLDFGLARRQKKVDRQPMSTLTKDGLILGTCPYMSPEQARGGDLDIRSDLFSLGVIFYEMLAGTRPFSGDSMADQISSILKDTPLSIRSVNTQVSRSLDKLLMGLLAKEPSSRPDSGGQLLTALTSCRREKRRITRRALMGLGAATVTTLFVLIAWNQWPPPRTKITGLLAYVENQTQDSFFDFVPDALLSLALFKIDTLEMLSRKKIPDALEQMRLETIDAIDQLPWLPIAVRLNADILIHASVASTADGFRITMAVFRPQEDTPLFTLIEGFSEKNQLMEAIERLTAELAELLPNASIHDNYMPLAQATSSPVEALIYYSHGVHFQARSEMDKATNQFRAAVASDPEFALAHARLSDCYSAMGNRQKALESAKNALYHGSRLPEWERFYIEGNYYKQTLQFENALDSYQRVLAQDQDQYHAYVHRQMIHCFAEQGMMTDAVDYAKRAHELDLTDVNSAGQYAITLACAGHFEDALRLAKALLRKHSDWVYLYWALGLAHLCLDNFKTAEDAFGKLDDGAEILMSERGFLQARVLTLQGRFKKARELIKSGVDFDFVMNFEENLKRRRYWMAELALLEGEEKQARELLMEMTELTAEPGNLRLLRKTALLAQKLGLKELAAKNQKKLRELHESYPSKLSRSSYRHVVGMAAFHRGDLEEAEEQLKEARKLRGDALNTYAFGQVLQQLNRPWDAVNHYKEILRRKGMVLYREFPAFWVSAHQDIASCYESMGQEAEARKYRSGYARYWG